MAKTIGKLRKVIILTVVQKKQSRITLNLVDPEKNNRDHHDTNLHIDFVRH